jgi:molybdopterin-binding protein
MAAYRMGQAAVLLGVSADTVRRWADEGKLATRRTAGGHRLIEGADLARFATELAESAGAEPVIAQSARNRLTGIVTRVSKDNIVAKVELQAGPHRIVSLMTREAADELELAPGILAVAAVKATNVVIELPPDR